MKKPTTIRLPEQTKAAIEELVQRTGQPFSQVVNEMLEEALRSRRIPGIAFADGPAGRRARVAGTGLDVFEIVVTYRQLDESWPSLQQAFHWLNDSQLRAALAYAQAYPDEIAARISLEDRWTAAELARQFPFTLPR